MTDHRDILHVFLAAPYTQWMNPELNELDPPRRAYLETLRNALLLDDAAVFNAHWNEDWGRSWLPSEICTPADFLAIRRSDVVCAVLGDPPSPGVLVELGWASALGKPVVLLVGRAVPQLVRGLDRLTAAIMIDSVEGWDEESLSNVVAAVRQYGRTECRSTDVDSVVGYPSTGLPLGYHVAAV